ncbi:hypothetical protein [Pedobacter sp. PACM 27299]|uniref:hypothetical protein n=1 Tax=Pedobacter sp. PACM 27299 TaxID=1727164 RepID=UPI0018D01DA2|nr:hypothetical protein [Pedobacter sp. PACM 27299]
MLKIIPKITLGINETTKISLNPAAAGKQQLELTKEKMAKTERTSPEPFNHRKPRHNP